MVGLADFAIPGTAMFIEPWLGNAVEVTGKEVGDFVALEPHVNPIRGPTRPHVYSLKSSGEAGNVSGVRSGLALATIHVANTVVESRARYILRRCFKRSIRTRAGICPGAESVLNE